VALVIATKLSSSAHIGNSRTWFLSLASVALLLRRARFGDAPWVDLGFAALGPAFTTHSLLLLAARPSSSEAKK
jgi:hypothetical protein